MDMYRELAATSDEGHRFAHPLQAQLCLWQILRNRQINGFQFDRQVLVAPFIVDFLCVELKLIVELTIELDFASDQQRQFCELRRTAYLRSKGYRVIRFCNGDVLTAVGKVAVKLQSIAQQSTVEQRPQLASAID